MDGSKLTSAQVGKGGTRLVTVLVLVVVVVVVVLALLVMVTVVVAGLGVTVVCRTVRKLLISLELLCSKLW